MIYLLLLVTINTLLIVVVVKTLTRKGIANLWTSLIEHLLLLLVGWAAFSLLAGLFVTFDMLEGTVESHQALLRGGIISMSYMLPGLIVIYFFLQRSQKSKV